MVTILADHGAEASESSLRYRTLPECRNSPFEILERKRLLALLVERLEQLPPMAKKILAMHYHEDLKLSEIAPCFGLSEFQIEEIRIQTVELLKNYLGEFRLEKPPGRQRADIE
jgi:DNA-directed RNA polymerase specialized sigma subunit